MNFKRIMIAAPKSGSGKTTITCALLQTLKNMGENVFSYKCGPDYIDTMFHKNIIGVPSKNLDTFFTNEEQTKELFLNNISENDFAVLEGVMGIFDGLGGIKEEGSTYHLAKITKTPIILVVDAKGMGRSILPFIAGFLYYDKEHIIKGVILNRISEGYYKTIKSIIEQELKITVLGFLPEIKEINIKSRYLGLVLPNEQKEIKQKLLLLSEKFIKTVSIDAIMNIAENAENITEYKTKLNKTVLEKKVVIAVAKDEAFCFYYDDNINILIEYGAEIKYFSPLHDEKLPECHALLIGGGYPELYAEKLSKNESMKKSIKQAIKNGIPLVAECGGFMYLHSAIIDKEGKKYTMVGMIQEKCFYSGKLVRFGYIEIQEKESNFLPKGERIKGHEFHYYDSTNNGEDAFAIKPITEKKYNCIMEGENYFIGYPHLYYPSNTAFAKSFIEKAIKYKENSNIKNSYRFFENKECNYFPCHEGINNLNCLFCYCPLYLQNCPGNPQYVQKGNGTIKICTNCTFPHQPENYDIIIEILKQRNNSFL